MSRMYNSEYQAAQDLLDELTSTLVLTKGGQVEFAFIHPGDIIPEYGCSQAAVRVVETTPTVQFPNPLPGPQKCGTYMHAVTLEMSVVRCYDRPPDNGMLSPAQINEQSKVLIDDAAAMRKAATCAWPDRTPHMPLNWSQYVHGDVYGGTMRVIVRANLGCGGCEGFTSIDDILAVD